MEKEILPVLVRERGERFAALMISLQCQFPKGALFSIVSGAGNLAIQSGFGKAEPTDGLFLVVVKDVLLHYCISTPQTDTYACLRRFVGGLESHDRSFLVRVAGGGANGLLWVSCDYHQGQIGIM